MAWPFFFSLFPSPFSSRRAPPMRVGSHRCQSACPCHHSSAGELSGFLQRPSFSVSLPSPGVWWQGEAGTTTASSPAARGATVGRRFSCRRVVERPTLWTLLYHQVELPLLDLLISWLITSMSKVRKFGIL